MVDERRQRWDLGAYTAYGLFYMSCQTVLNPKIFCGKFITSTFNEEMETLCFVRTTANQKYSQRAEQYSGGAFDLPLCAITKQHFAYEEMSWSLIHWILFLILNILHVHTSYKMLRMIRMKDLTTSLLHNDCSRYNAPIVMLRVAKWIAGYWATILV